MFRRSLICKSTCVTRPTCHLNRTLSMMCLPSFSHDCVFVVFSCHSIKTSSLCQKFIRTFQQYPLTFAFDVTGVSLAWRLETRLSLRQFSQLVLKMLGIHLKITRAVWSMARFRHKNNLLRLKEPFSLFGFTANNISFSSIVLINAFPSRIRLQFSVNKL